MRLAVVISHKTAHLVKVRVKGEVEVRVRRTLTLAPTLTQGPLTSSPSGAPPAAASAAPHARCGHSCMCAARSKDAAERCGAPPW